MACKARYKSAQTVVRSVRAHVLEAGNRKLTNLLQSLVFIFRRHGEEFTAVPTSRKSPCKTSSVDALVASRCSWTGEVLLLGLVSGNVVVKGKGRGLEIGALCHSSSKVDVVVHEVL